MRPNGLELSRSAARAWCLHSGATWRPWHHSVFARQPSRLQRVVRRRACFCWLAQAIAALPRRLSLGPHLDEASMRLWLSPRCLDIRLDLCESDHLQVGHTRRREACVELDPAMVGEANVPSLSNPRIETQPAI